jgi:predicted dehydrogenase
MSIGIAVVGLGMAHKPHIAALRELSAEGRARILACHAPSPERREAFGKLHPDLPLAADLRAVLADPAIDAVILLTPPMTHSELVASCAAAGKHVLLEKPLDVTVERAQQSVELMERAGLRFGVVLQHRFRQASKRLAAILGSGALGEVISASAAIRWWRPPDYYAQPGRGMKARDGGGVLLTQAIHTLDLFQSLAGQVTRIAAIAPRVGAGVRGARRGGGRRPGGLPAGQLPQAPAGAGPRTGTDRSAPGRGAPAARAVALRAGPARYARQAR